MIGHGKRVCIVPLMTDSSHRISINRRWPAEFVRTLQHITTHEKDALEAKNTVINRFMKYGASQTTIKQIVSANPFGSSHRPMLPVNPVPQCRVWWVVVPYHPIWPYGKLGAVVKGVDEDSTMEYLMLSAFNGRLPACIKLSYRNGIQHCEFIYRRYAELSS